MRPSTARRLATVFPALACSLALWAFPAPPALAAQGPDVSLVAANPVKDPDLSREAEVARQQRLQEAQVQAARGRQALATGRYAEARDAFRKAAHLDPDDPASRRLLAEAEAVLALGPSQAALLDRAKERVAFEAQSLRAQVGLDLFEADRALAAKDYAEAVRRSEAALANARYVGDAARAAALRKSAEKTLAAARAGLERTAPLSPKKGPDRAQTEHARAADPGATPSDDGLPSTFPNLRAGSAERRAKFNRFMDDLAEEAMPPDAAKVVLAGKQKAQYTHLLERPMEPWERALREKLKQTVTVEFRETPLPEAVRQLRSLGNVNIVLDPRAADQAPPVTMRFTRKPIDAVLHWVARFGRLEYCLRDGAVLLTSHDGVLQEPIEKVYDVSHFLHEPDDADPQVFVGPREPGAPHQAAARRAPEIAPDTLGEGWVDFIRTTVAAGTWDTQNFVLGKEPEKSPFTITYRNGRIVVVHTPEVHEQIEELLNNFRRSRNLQVHVQARFIFLTRASLERLNIGFTYDNLKGTNGRVMSTFDAQDQVPNLSRFAGFDTTDGSGTPAGLNLTIAHMGNTSLQAFIAAVLKNQTGTVLQAPRLTMFNTQRANLQVLVNHNYIQSVSGDNVPTIGNIPEGMIFDVQPFVSADRRYITLTLQPQQRELVSLVDFHFLTNTNVTQTVGTNTGIATLAPFEVHIQIPTTRLRSVGTTVTIPNGGTLLVAGFAEIEENSGVGTIPFIETIPILSQVFRGWDRNEGRRDLIVLVSAQTVPEIFEE